MSVTPRIAIIMSTTRNGRFADRPANWILSLAQQRADLVAELVDLRDYPMPFFDEPRSPMWEPPASDEARRWAETIGRFDGFIFVTAEYNHGIPAVLKNALDYVYAPMVRKPAACVGYGNVGAARAIEQLRLNLIESHVAPLRNAVHIGVTEFIGLLREGKDFADYPHLVKAAGAMFDELVWWASALKTARQAGID